MVSIENFTFSLQVMFGCCTLKSIYNELIKSMISKEIKMQSGNHETYIRKCNCVDFLSCYEKVKQNILTKLKEN